MMQGPSLQEILEMVQPDPVLRAHAHISIGDMPIPQKNWHLIKPKAGRSVTIRVIPHGGGGGGGKSPLRTILSIAVIAASFYFGPALGAYMAGTTVAAASTTMVVGSLSYAALGSALISVVGTLLISALVPMRAPKMAALSGGQSSQESPTLFISGSRNQARPFGPISVILGRHKCIPPYGALPYTEIVGSDQYVRLVFVWGYGPLLIEDLKIGTTPIENYSDVQYVNRMGYPGDPGLSIYTNDIYEESLSILLTSASGYVIRNSQTDADEISVDFIFGRGLTIFDNSGNRTETTVELDVEYAPVGSTTWVGGGTAIGSTTSSAMTAESSTVKVLKPGYEPDYAARRIAAGEAESTYYRYLPATTPHRYDLVVMDRYSGDVSVIKGQSVQGSTDASIPVWSTTQIPLAAVYRDTDSVIVAGDITDYRSQTTGWGTGFAVTDNGTDTVAIASGTLNSGRQTITGATSEALRHNVRFAVPTRGQYQVRCRRVTTDSTDNSTFDEVTWGVLRTITYEEPFEANGLATTEIRIKATDQLNQVIDQLNGIVTSILPDYDYVSEDWIVRPTQNPASLMRAVLQGPGNKRGIQDSRINLDSLIYFHNYCRTNGFQFNMVRDFVSSVWDAMADVCVAAFAAPCQVDGQWGVIIDEDKTVPIQHFTPRNSSNFSFEKTYVEKPHAWRIRFVNEDNDFKQDERIVYDDGYDATNATRFESFDLSGITDPDMIYVVGRRRIAEARLRPEKYTFNTDIEHLVCTRGDMVLLTHDVISLGLGVGRIKELVLDIDDNVTGLVLDSPIAMQTGTDYGISIRTIQDDEERRILRQVVTQNDTGITEIELSTSIPAATSPQVGDIYGFGELENESMEVVITGITCGNNLNALVTCVPLSRAIFSASSGAIPEFDPNITSDVGALTPFVISIRSDETVLVLQPNGMLVPNLRLTFGRFSSSIINRPSGVEVQYREVNESVFRSKFFVRQEVLEADLPDVVQGLQYQVKARYTYADKTGEFSPTYTHTVIGMATPPDDVTGLVVEGNYLRWRVTKPQDFAGFKVRTSTDTTATWGSMIVAHPGFLSDAQFDITNFRRGIRVFAVKMYDLAGNESTTEASLIRDFSEVPLQYVLDTIDYSGDGFPGTLVGCAVNIGVLEADDTSTYLPNGTDLYLPAGGDSYLMSQFLELSYTTEVLAIDSSIIPGRVLVREESTNGVQVLYRVGISPIWPDDAELFASPSDELFLGYEWRDEEYRAFPEYVDLVLGDYFQFKLLGTAGELQSSVSLFRVYLDALYQSETFNAVVLDAAGSRIPLTKTYRSLIMVNPNIRTGGTAVRIEVIDLDETSGPMVRAFNSGGTGVAATVDGTITGVEG